MPMPLSFKRRRLDEAQSKLSRPFVSPLRTPGTSASSHRPSERNVTGVGGSDTEGDAAIATRLKHSSESQTKTASANEIATQGSPIRKRIIGVNSAQSTLDPEEVAVQKEIASLERQIRQARGDIDALEQAIRISASSGDDKLKKLFAKWQQASQDATEAVYDDVKRRIDEGGGVGAWRAKERERREERFRFEREELNDSKTRRSFEASESLHEEPSEQLTDEPTVTERTSTIDSFDPTNNSERDTQDASDNEDVFTIGMMLHSLNIPLDLIGYDAKTEAWFTD